MPRTPVHTVHDAPEASRDGLKALEGKLGTVLNIHGAMAHSPVVLNAYLAFQGALADHGTFDARTREAIALAVAAVDECSYCQAAHTGAGAAAGLSRDEMTAVRRGDDRDVEPRLAALLAVAREYTAEVGTVRDETWQAALDAGWSVAELTEVSAHVTVNLLTNYFNHFVGTDLDLPPAPAL